MSNSGSAERASTADRKKKISTVVWSAVSVLLIVLIALILIGKLTDVHIIPISPIWVLTGSMEPTIPAESYILVQYIDASEVEEGDVIMFYSGDPALAGTPNTHRVKEIIGDNESFVTQGDAYVGEDEYIVKADDVIARYVTNLTVLTFLGRAFSSLAGLVVVLCILVGGCTVWMYIFVKQQKAAKEREIIDRLVAEEVKKLEAQNKASSDENDKRTKS